MRRLLLAALLAVGLLGLLAGPAAAAPFLVPPPAPSVGEQPAVPTPAPAPGAGGTDADGPAAFDLPEVIVEFDGEADDGLSRALALVLLLGVGSVAPGILLLMTPFLRFVIVLSILKQALGLQTVPPAQVLSGIALILTFFVLQPELVAVNNDALQPLLAGELDQRSALTAAFEPLRDFMLARVGERELLLFTDLAPGGPPANPDDLAASALIGAYALSELRAAFIIGFIIYVPFLMIDLIVSAVLMSQGMVMLPPIFISLPIKLLLFILVDGWELVVGQVVASVGAG